MTDSTWKKLKADAKIYRAINGERIRSALINPWLLFLYVLAILLAVFYLGH
jgi:hypothetical protein